MVYALLQELYNRLEAMKIGMEEGRGGYIEKLQNILRELPKTPHEIKLGEETVFVEVDKETDIYYLPKWITGLSFNFAYYPKEKEAEMVIRRLDEFYRGSKIARNVEDLRKKIEEEQLSILKDNKELREYVGRKINEYPGARQEEILEILLQDEKYKKILREYVDGVKENKTSEEFKKKVKELTVIETAYYFYLIYKYYFQPHYLSIITGEARFKFAPFGRDATPLTLFIYLISEAERRCGENAKLALSLFNRLINANSEEGEVRKYVVEVRNIEELKNFLFSRGNSNK